MFRSYGFARLIALWQIPRSEFGSRDREVGCARGTDKDAVDAATISVVHYFLQELPIDIYTDPSPIQLEPKAVGLVRTAQDIGTRRPIDQSRVFLPIPRPERVAPVASNSEEVADVPKASPAGAGDNPKLIKPAAGAAGCSQLDVGVLRLVVGEHPSVPMIGVEHRHFQIAVGDREFDVVVLVDRPVGGTLEGVAERGRPEAGFRISRGECRRRTDGDARRGLRGC